VPHCTAVTDVHADVEHAPVLTTELVTVASTVPKLTPETVATAPPERAKLGVCTFVTAGASKLKTPVPVPTSPATVKY